MRRKGIMMLLICLLTVSLTACLSVEEPAEDAQQENGAEEAAEEENAEETAAGDEEGTVETENTDEQTSGSETGSDILVAYFTYAENAELPDLLMIDGGKGQVNAVYEILEALDIADKIAVIGLAKEHEELVPPKDGKTIRLEHSNEGLRVLIAVRDECHRFATSFNQRMRSKEASFSLLESIDGMGKKRSEKVMKRFGSIEAILSLSAEELKKEAGIPLSVAEKILHKLNF